ncbi:MAG: hypothetical protein Q8K23_20540, partial [Sulfuritalea sp.]|nr:hypothetical protein [Sulfuritalea sp.]
SFNDTLATASGLTQANGAGAVTFKKGVTIAAGDTATTLNGNVILNQAGGLTFQAARSVTFGDAATDQVTLAGGPVSISTTANSGVLVFNSKVDGAQSLSLATNGTGTINFNGVVGGVTSVGNLTAVAGGAITFGPMTVIGNLDAKTLGGSVVQTGVLTISGDLWIKTTAGSIDFYSSGMNTLGGTVSLIDASLSNEVKLSADSIRVGTAGPSNGSIVDADTGIQGARVTIKAPSGAAIQADGLQGLITAAAPFDSTVASLTIDTSSANGNVGDPLTATPTTAGLRVHTSGLVVVIGNAAGDGTIMLVGDDAVQPKYPDSGDPLFRPVMYNGVQATNAQLSGALDSVTLDIRNLTAEIRESGFAKENASKVLRRGVVTSAGPGQPAVDDSTGLAGLEQCDGTFGGGSLACQ